MSVTTVPDWPAQAACVGVDPDLFFPDPDTPMDRVEEAKRICGACPVKHDCLTDAIRLRDWEGIRGGLTPNERHRIAPVNKARGAGKASARQLAVKHGAYLLSCLVEYRMSVAQVAEELGSTPMAVYCAFLILVPARPGRQRTKQPSQLEQLLAVSGEALKLLQRRGLSQSEIGIVLGGVPQSLVSAALGVLRQREKALRHLAGDGSLEEALRRLQAEEIRVRRESGAGMTVWDVIDVAGPEIRRLHDGHGLSLRRVADELGLCRESVRKAYLEMTKEKQGVKGLVQSELEEAA